MRNNSSSDTGHLSESQSRNTFPSRRSFLAASTALGLTLDMAPATGASVIQDTANRPFSLKFAPHPGMFKALSGKDVTDQINFCHEMGFTAFEHNGMKRETPEKQQQIGDLLKEHSMEMGVFVAYADFVRGTFTNPNKKTTNEILDQIKESIDVAKRCGAKFVTVVPGSIDQPTPNGNKYGGGRLAEGFQTGYAIDMLRKCAEILQPEDIVMVLEPLNWHTNHGGTFLRDSDQAYAICRAVDSPSCKILFDIYHQQISEGNLIPNINRAWDEIGYFQAGDNPGRKEPGTGEINYVNVFKAIAQRQKKDGRDLIIGMEHGKSIGGKEGEQAVIDAYRAVEP